MSGKAASVPSGVARWMTLGGVFAVQAKQRPERVWLRFEDEQVTSGELEQRSNAYGNALPAHGVQRQDCVAVLMENSVELVSAWFGIAKLGAIEVAVNAAHKGESDRIFEIADELPDVLVIAIRADGVRLEDVPAAPARITTTDLATRRDPPPRPTRFPRSAPCGSGPSSSTARRASRPRVGAQ